MLSRETRRKAAGLTLGIAGVGALVVVGLVRRPAGLKTGPDGHSLNSPASSRELFPGTSTAAAPAPETPEEIAKQVEAALAAWRNAVLAKDADTVVKLDATFHDAPGRYTAALVKSAETDANERVRAFSTRVLGKLKQAELADAFERLLQDGSPFVRQNAAWALGELGADPDGKAAARHAMAELRHVRSRDSAGDVRAAAKGALGKLE